VGNRRFLSFVLDLFLIVVYNTHMVKKQRINYNVTSIQAEVLRIAARQKELSASELLRRIIDDWIETNAQDIQVQVVSQREADSSD